MIAKTIVGIVLVVVAVYGLIEARPLLSGPSLSVEPPTDGLSVPSGILEVRGRALRIASFTLDGAPVLPDEKGAFSTTLTFPRGTSILTFVAKDRFGRTVTVTRTIYVPN